MLSRPVATRQTTVHLYIQQAFLALLSLPWVVLFTACLLFADKERASKHRIP